MISYRDWLSMKRQVVRLKVLLTTSIAILFLVTICLFKETDITPQKLDKVSTETKTEKGNIMTNRYRWSCELIRVVDGDTLEAWILLDFGVKLEAKLRLEGIDTPEIHTVKTNTEEYTKGLRAKEFVEARFKNCGPKFWIETDGKRPGKYGRFVVNVLLASGDYLDALLLKAGHAVKKEY
ncbi:MAG: thermonuclease family protein [Actinomycetia bacterium]|nr:thermonuclease family protein [Actinomycetes bacterium]